MGAQLCRGQPGCLATPDTEPAPPRRVGYTTARFHPRCGRSPTRRVGYTATALSAQRRLQDPGLSTLSRQHNPIRY